jgi:hypothetical protein
VESKELIMDILIWSECPFCGERVNCIELRYCNTHRLRGYEVGCAVCKIFMRECPSGWTTGQEEETMAAAKLHLHKRWNLRVK